MSAYNANWSLMTPEIVLGILALVIFTIDFMTGVKGKKPFLGRMSIIALLVTAVLVYINRGAGTIADIFIVDHFSTMFKIILLVGVAIVIAISMHYLDKNDDVYQGEFYSLMLFAALGAMLMVSSADLITLYIGLELLSISSYCLAGFKKHNRKSTEGAIKYVVLGGTASAFILYGMSFLYGLTGTTSIIDISQVISSLYVDYPFIVVMSILFMLAGFGFKISIVPFHMWAPDVYEGSPTPVTAFLSVVSKIAGFAIVLRVFFTTFLGSEGVLYDEWTWIIAIIATVTMIVGNLIALTQKNIKRLMAYSGVAQAGYLLVPIAAIFIPSYSIGVIIFYSIVYVFMTLGAFAIITLVTEDSGRDDFSSFSGLYKRSPYMAIAMSVFLLGLAGLPLTAGFVGKAWIFISAAQAGMLWLAGVMFVTSVISFYYYFGVIKQMFMNEPNPNDVELKAPLSISVVVTIALAVTIILGVLPGLMIDWIAYIQW
ncbi:NADH-quinone oxidoreductase subunit N [Evansella sp. AB-P1]|uniref:NADH-quinone oxidoreductase subunit N n=1 Tax=Evansella sp. AB-P1 TaxID=3037653 RepID=UPI00241C4A9D|nr:NADH-quinone oxidoreductase subunit N [Evansella sp. AB-P1]MDG5787295.1 NADH-quinone oxidoreductase subunit N [Evansella sp. AB-P1]